MPTVASVDAGYHRPIHRTDGVSPERRSCSQGPHLVRSPQRLSTATSHAAGLRRNTCDCPRTGSNLGATGGRPGGDVARGGPHLVAHIPRPTPGNGYTSNAALHALPQPRCIAGGTAICPGKRERGGCFGPYGHRGPRSVTSLPAAARDCASSFPASRGCGRHVKRTPWVGRQGKHRGSRPVARRRHFWAAHRRRGLEHRRHAMSCQG
jgi:hypothetical protein